MNAGFFNATLLVAMIYSPVNSAKQWLIILYFRIAPKIKPDSKEISILNTLLNTKIEDLSRRSQNIISELGGIEQLLDFYNKNKSFLSIPKVGQFTEGELISFCNYLNGKEMEETEFDSDKDLNLPDVVKSIAIYEYGKSLLSTRTRNGLTKIEIKNKYDQSVENKVSHIKTLFFSRVDFLSIQNLGIKCKLELESLKDKITEGLFDNEGERKLYFSGGKYLPDRKFFPISFNENEIGELFVDEQYSFKKMLCIFLFTTDKMRKKDRIVLKNFFFNELQPKTKRILSDELHCSFERVRQIQRRLYDALIPRTVKLLLKSFKGKPFDLPEKNNSDVLYLYDFPHFTFRETHYTPNTEFSQTIYNYFLKEDYTLLNVVIKQQKFKSFEISKNCFFISKKFIEKTKLLQLLDWLDEKIYRFESVASDYDPEALIKKYYKEINKKISRDLLQDVYSIVIRIRKENFELNLGALKKVHKKSRMQSMLREVYSFLKEKNEGQTTLKILEHLHKKNFEINRVNLSICLNKNKETFAFFGLGYWVLKEWGNNENIPSGSVREIVRNLLSDRDDPIHISELYQYLNSIKKISLNSIKYNLKFATGGTFKFFNCSYIGLSEKKYDSYWHNIPKAKAIYLTPKRLANYKDQSDIVNHFSSKFGCPKQHIVFLLECKNGKYRKR